MEEIAFKIACEFANEILRNMLEEYDKKIMDSRDTKEFRHKGKETTTVKAKTGLKYRNMGCQESNNYCRLTRRMKKKRMSWSKNGSENIDKVITMYASENCTDIIKDLNMK